LPKANEVGETRWTGELLHLSAKIGLQTGDLINKKARTVLQQSLDHADLHRAEYIHFVLLEIWLLCRIGKNKQGWQNIVFT